MAQVREPVKASIRGIREGSTGEAGKMVNETEWVSKRCKTATDTRAAGRTTCETVAENTALPTVTSIPAVSKTTASTARAPTPGETAMSTRESLKTEIRRAMAR